MLVVSGLGVISCQQSPRDHLPSLSETSDGERKRTKTTCSEEYHCECFVSLLLLLAGSYNNSVLVIGRRFLFSLILFELVLPV